MGYRINTTKDTESFQKISGNSDPKLSKKFSSLDGEQFISSDCGSLNQQGLNSVKSMITMGVSNIRCEPDHAEHEHKHTATQIVIQNDIFDHPTRLNGVVARAVNGSKFDIQWYHKNYLDHVYAVSDDSGDILEHYRYTAFGEVTIYDASGAVQSASQIDNDILWNTRRLDEVSGFYLYKYRHYSPELGRWLGRDPIEEWGGVNLYAFVENYPIGKWDRLGLAKIKVGGTKTTHDLNPGVRELAAFPGGRVQRVRKDSEGVAVIKIKVEAKCICTRPEKFLLEEYTITIHFHVYLTSKFESEKHKQFVIDNENDHVKDFTDWANSQRAKNVVNAYEQKRKNNSNNNIYKTEAECVAGNIEKFEKATPLKSSANDAVAKSIRKWDRGRNAKHKWRGGE